MESGWRLPALRSVGYNTSSGLRAAGPSETQAYVCLCQRVSVCVYTRVVPVYTCAVCTRVWCVHTCAVCMHVWGVYTCVVHVTRSSSRTYMSVCMTHLLTSLQHV